MEMMAVKRAQNAIATQNLPEITISSELFKDVEGFVAFEVRDQDRIINRHKQIVSNYRQASKNIHDVMADLYEQRNIMKKSRTWEAYLAQRVIPDAGMSRATIMRGLMAYEVEQKMQLPAAITEQLSVIGKTVNVKKIGHLPKPPANPTLEEAKEFAQAMVSSQRTSKVIHGSDTSAASQVRHSLKTATILRDMEAEYKSLTGKAKQKFILDICSYALFIGGIQTAQTIAPGAIPDALVYSKIKPRGRPKLKQA